MTGRLFRRDLAGRLGPVGTPIAPAAECLAKHDVWSARRTEQVG